MAQLTFELVTPEGVKFHEEVYEILLPTAVGQIGVLPGHEPLVSLAVPGVITIRPNPETPDRELEHLATGGGLIQITHNHVRLLADTAERAKDIDELRAKEALERARDMHKTAEDHVSLADATALIERNIARLETVELKRRHRPHPDERPVDIHLHSSKKH